MGRGIYKIGYNLVKLFGWTVCPQPVRQLRPPQQPPAPYLLHNTQQNKCDTVHKNNLKKVPQMADRGKKVCNKIKIPKLLNFQQNQHKNQKLNL